MLLGTTLLRGDSGLVFLSGFVATKDVAFAASFVGLSALAAATTNLGLWNQDNDARVPGVVALGALVLGRPLVGYGLLPLLDLSPLTGELDLPPFTVIPPTFEIAVCAISVAWALFNWKNFKEKASE